jgi:biopolymer transport protein ExbD
MRMGGSKDNNDEAEVAMSPLIDAVFLLLIFFLVATIEKKEDRDVDLIPPESMSDVRLLPDDDQAVVAIDAAGTFYWQGFPRTLTQLHDELRLLGIADPTRRLRLDADRAAPFEKVVEVLDAAQFHQLNNVGVRTYDDRYNAR